MQKNRREARERLKAIKTVAELREYIDSLNLSDEERDIAMMFYHRGWTCNKISLETGYSLRQVTRKLAKIADKL